MRVAVESLNFVPVRRPEMLETSVFERMIDVIAPLVGLVVAMPTIVGHVRQVVDAPAFLALGSVGRSVIRGAAGDRGCVPGWCEAHSVRARRVSLRIVARSADDPPKRPTTLRGSS